MKTMNLFIKKIVLLSMLLFVMHDFVLGQLSIVSENHSISTPNYISKSSTLVVNTSEHNLFHSPFLMHQEPCFFQKSLKQKNLFEGNQFLTQFVSFPIFTPPKTA